MTARTILACLVGLLAILAAPLTSPAITIYGGTGTGGSPASNDFSLVTVDEFTGAVTRIGAASYNPGLDFGPEGRILYGTSNSLRVINPLTGSFSTVGPLTENGVDQILMRSMAISPAGEMYGVSNVGSHLYRIDTATGLLTLRGTVPVSVFGLEFLPNGKLYAAFARLYELDPMNASVIEDLGPLGAFVVDMDYGHDGIMRGVHYNTSNTPALDGKLYRISMEPGVNPRATLMSTITTAEVWGIATVPEPATLTMAALGVSFVAALGIRSVRRPRRR